MDIQKIKDHIVDFLKNARAIELYNEFSLQHELGIYLRNKFEEEKGEKYSIQFERNISFFGYDDNSIPSKCKWKEQEWVKKEIDIVIFNDKEKFAIELKFPRNRAYPRRMFQFIEDIRFLEQLKDAGFDGGCALVLVDDKNFYTKTGRETSDIYQYFRNNNSKKKIGKEEKGDVVINNPLNKEKPPKVYINGCYEIKWCNEINFCGRDKYNGEKEAKNDEWKYYIVTF